MQSKTKPTRVCVDLESLGTRPGSIITSIGATKFDENGPYGEPFYMRIDMQSCVDAGLLIDVDTVKWWMKQSEDARAEFQKASFPITDVLKDLTAWMLQDLKLGSFLELWGNGANFDNNLLGEAYRRCGLTQPWMFWNDRCYRTLKAMYPHIKMPARVGAHHNALDDAISQVNHLILLPCFQELCVAEKQAAMDAEQQLKLEVGF
jgi:exodeoxyribonuclease VIII